MFKKVLGEGLFSVNLKETIKKRPSPELRFASFKMTAFDV